MLTVVWPLWFNMARQPIRFVNVRTCYSLVLAFMNVYWFRLLRTRRMLRTAADRHEADQLHRQGMGRVVEALAERRGDNQEKTKRKLHCAK